MFREKMDYFLCDSIFHFCKILCEINSPKKLKWWRSELTVWKLRKLTVILFWQKFRQINAFTKEIILINILIVVDLTKFPFSVRVNFPLFHTVQCNCGNSLSPISGKNFVKVTVLLNKLLKS